MRIPKSSTIVKQLPKLRSALSVLLLTALILSLFAASAQSTQAATANLVKNGSFEKDTNGDGVPNSWTRFFPATATDKRVCNQSHAGACSLRLVGDLDTKDFRQEIPVNGLANDEYILSVWTKKKDLVLGGGQARLSIQFHHTDGSSNFTVILILAGSATWTLSQYSQAHSTENFDSITVFVHISADSGKVWFDKVKLVEVP